TPGRGRPAVACLEAEVAAGAIALRHGPPPPDTPPRTTRGAPPIDEIVDVRVMNYFQAFRKY
ncbi:MAG: hypothetical protein ACQSGP_27965, partial [Frankia sp.]